MVPHCEQEEHVAALTRGAEASLSCAGSGGPLAAVLHSPHNAECCVCKADCGGVRETAHTTLTALCGTRA